MEVVAKVVGRCHFWQDAGYRDTHWTPKMDITQRAGLLQLTAFPELILGDRHAVTAILQRLWYSIIVLHDYTVNVSNIC